MELMEYLRNTRIEDLNTRMMGATVHDIESQSEMQDKLGKFSVFARTKPPSASYLFDTKVWCNDMRCLLNSLYRVSWIHI